MIPLTHKDYFRRVGIPQLYAKVHSDIKKIVAGKEFFFSATADLWSSVTTEPYLSYIIHYINDDWMLQSYCLQAHFMPESHTGANLRDSLLATLQEWNLNEKRQLVLTTDNAANIKLDCRLLNWRQIDCFGQ